MTTMKIFIGLLFLFVSTEARSLHSTSDDGLWTPDGDVSRDDWYRCHGLPCDDYMYTQETLEQLFVLESGLTADEADPGPVYPARNNGTLDGCIMMIPQQADWMLQHNMELHQQEDLTGHTKDGQDTLSRKKRKITDFDVHGFLKWDAFPIVFKFDGKHSEPEKQIIRSAFRHWEEHTCVRFREADMDEQVQGQYILLTNEEEGCYSYVGMVPIPPQQLNLADACLWEFGIPVHEVGHTLGLWHEQMRVDRDDYIRINWENVGFYRGQLVKVDYAVGLGVRYDYQSVMHYSPLDTSFNGQIVMESHDPLYQSSMGQRTGLSYSDAQIINRAYCSDVCSFRLPRDCANNGYQDPNNCDICRCPEGLSGRFCEEVAPPKNAACGGLVQLPPFGFEEITSPGYDSVGFYDNRQECNWWIKAPANHKVQLEFVDQFGLYCHHQGECHHWVEVRYNGELGQNGPRFCCHETPTATLLSSGEDVLVIFRANWTTGFANSRRGFKAAVRAVPVGPAEPSERPTTTTTTTTTRTTTTPTTTTTTTTTTPAPTTTTPTTTTRKSGPYFRWSCDFEDASGSGTLADMTQEWNDQFDWSLQTGPTRSQETGPPGAYSGQYYVYIEASNPRKRNDQAILHLPVLGVRGLHCLHFHYHMYGFHVNELRVVQESHGHVGQLWSKVKQQGNEWLEARVNVFLQQEDRLSFVGIRGGEYSGDIALDAIELTEGICEDNALP